MKTLLLASIYGSLLIAASHSNASSCSYPAGELANHFNSLSSRHEGTFTLVSVAPASIDNQWQVSVERSGANDRTLTVNYLHNDVDAANTQLANGLQANTAQAYYAIIAPPGASEQARRLDVTPTPANEMVWPYAEKDRYPATSLGTKGAIILVRRDRVNACSDKLEPIYLLPDDASVLNPQLQASLISLPRVDFDKFLASVMSVGGRDRIVGNTPAELLAHDVAGSHSAVRYQMLQPFVVSMEKGSVRPEVAKSITVPLIMPLRFDNEDVIKLSVFPQSVSYINSLMRDRNADPSGYKLKQRHAATPFTAEEIEKILADIEKKFQSFGVAIELAVEDMAKETQASQSITDPMEQGLIGQALFSAQRMLGNAKTTLTIYQQQYDFWYGQHTQQRAVVYDTATFDSNSYAQLTLDHAGLACSLTPQTIKGPAINVDFLGQSIKAASDIYVYYRARKDLTYKQVLFQPHFVMAAEVNGMHQVHQNLVSQHIPASSCRHKYKSLNDVTTGVSGGKVKGKAGVHYEKWVCENVSYPCWDWGPKICNRAFKSKIFSVDRHYDMNVSAYAAKGPAIKLSLWSPFVQRDHLVPLTGGESDSLVYDTLKMKWGRFDFLSPVVNPAGVMLTGVGRGKEFRGATICEIHKAVSGLAADKLTAK